MSEPRQIVILYDDAQLIMMAAMYGLLERPDSEISEIDRAEKDRIRAAYGRLEVELRKQI